MPFSEKVKLEAKTRSAFRCCICKKMVGEVHHIIPQSENGPNTLDNAAPLCASCHDLFGSNPEKRTQIRQMRDEWWEFVAQWRRNLLSSRKLTDGDVLLPEDVDDINLLKKKNYALLTYYVYEDENFATSAASIYKMVQETQRIRPSLYRVLVIDIEGHRLKNGAFDHEMIQLQHEFILGFMLDYLKEAYMPLISVQNPRKQRNDLPEVFIVTYDKIDLDNIPSEPAEITLYRGDTHQWYRLDKK